MTWCSSRHLFLAVALAARGVLGYIDAMDMLGVNLAVPAGGVKVSDLAKKAAWLGVVRVKLFDYDEMKVVALRKAYYDAGKRVSIAVALPNWMHTDEDMHKLIKVVKHNLDVVQTVFVYNEPCLSGYCKGKKGENYLRRLKYITKELAPHKVEVTTPFSMGGILTDTYPPQNSKFKDPDFMRRVVETLAIGNNTLFANLYPYLDIACNPDVPLNYALGELPQASVEGVLFTSQVDADIKALRFAIQKLGGDFSNVKVGIGETGWAHSGGKKPKNQSHMRVWDLSSTHYSNKFYANIATSLSNNQWTEQNLGRIYIFDLADEPLKAGHYPAYDGEKYFGIAGLWTKEDKQHIAPWKWEVAPQPEAIPAPKPLEDPANAACIADVQWVFNTGKNGANAAPLYGTPMGKIGLVDFAQASLEDWQRLFFCAPPGDLKKRCGTPPLTCTTPPCGVCGPPPGKKPEPAKTTPIIPEMRPRDYKLWKIIEEREGGGKHAEQKWEKGTVQTPTQPIWGYYAAAGLAVVAAASAVAGLVVRMRKPVGALQAALQQDSELETGDDE